MTMAASVSMAIWRSFQRTRVLPSAETYQVLKDGVPVASDEEGGSPSRSAVGLSQTERR